MNRLTLFIVLIASSGCTNADLNDDSASMSEVNRRIAVVLGQTAPCEDIDRCDTVSVALKAKSASPSSLGQRILVIDAGMVLPAYTRYKSRVLDYLVLDEQGNYESSKQEIRIPRTIFTVLSEILDEQYPTTTAHELNSVFDLFVQHKKVLNPLIGHGDIIFATLADLNPEAEFVLADFGNWPIKDFCAANEDQAALERFMMHTSNTVSSLKRAIEKYQVNFVNMSFGHSGDTFRETWHDQCSGKTLPNDSFFRELQATYFCNFYESLFSLNNVLFLQSAPSSTRDLAESDSEFYSDCQPVTNRIRVAGFSSKESDLPILGDSEHRISPGTKGALGCTDIAINFGVSAKRPFEDGPFPVMLTSTGVGAHSLGTRPTNSVAAPLGLSYANYLKRSGLVEGDGQLFVENFKKYHTGKLVEPARYRQFEIYRLGRR